MVASSPDPYNCEEIITVGGTAKAIIRGLFTKLMEQPE
jgi:hypothetical protein